MPSYGMQTVRAPADRTGHRGPATRAMRACECMLALATSPVSSLATLRFPVSRPTTPPFAPMLAAHQNTSSGLHGRIECTSGEHVPTTSYQADAPHARHLMSVRQHGTVYAPNALTGDLARLEVSTGELGLYERLSAAPCFFGIESRLMEIKETVSEVKEVVPRMERSIMMEWCEAALPDGIATALPPLLPPPPPLLPPLPPLSPPPPPPPPLDTLAGILVQVLLHICLLGLCATMIYAIRRMICACVDDFAMDLQLTDTTNQAQADAADAQNDAIQSYATYLSLARDTA